MAEAQDASRVTSEAPPTQTAPEDALLHLRSEILKQILSELNSEAEARTDCSGSGFAKWVSFTKLGGLDSGT